ncbi:MAG: flavodoxin family protein [Clostridia bacterium]|nr:flavodoxin family protein [Clostridia bacterium]
MRKILIISTSLHGGSNSELLAKECARGAADAGDEVEFYSLKGRTLQYCIGCLACQAKGKCVLSDDAAFFVEKAKDADILVFATPIYYYEMSGQMKTLLDRLNPLYPTDYKFRKVYMIATAAEEGDFVFEKAYQGLRGFVDCFEKAQLCGLLAGGGMETPNAAKADEGALTRAYDMGKSL